MKKVLAFSALPLALLFAAAFQSSNSVPGQLAAIQSQLSSLQAQIASKGPRKFYLTKTDHDGAHALTACETGYHMASIWEIHEPSDMAYNTALGLTALDTGFGPPAFVGGWIRTGLDADTLNVPGQANCRVWTSNLGLPGPDRGTFALLSIASNQPATEFSPWFFGAGTCDTSRHVWCVQD